MSASRISIDGKSYSEFMLSGIMTGACVGLAGGLLKSFNEQAINDFAIGFFKILQITLAEVAKGAIVGGVVTGFFVGSAVCAVEGMFSRLGELGESLILNK